MPRTNPKRPRRRRPVLSRWAEVAVVIQPVVALVVAILRFLGDGG